MPTLQLIPVLDVRNFVEIPAQVEGGIVQVAQLLVAEREVVEELGPITQGVCPLELAQRVFVVARFVVRSARLEVQSRSLVLRLGRRNRAKHQRQHTQEANVAEQSGPSKLAPLAGGKNVVDAASIDLFR